MANESERHEGEDAEDTSSAEAKPKDPRNTGQKTPVILEDATFASADGTSQVAWRLWHRADDASEPPRGVIQLVHGMAEHISRYDELARFFVSQGYVVAGHDHIGHGHTAASPKDLGHMPLTSGADILVQDTHTLHDELSERYGALPHVLYGHSMGSFVARMYLTRYGQELAAVILSGTAHVPATLSGLGLTTARALATIRGERAHSSLVNTLALGSYNSAIKHPRTPFDWISSDDTVVDEYMADELSGYRFTLGGYSALLTLALDMVSYEAAAAVPSNLPILLVSGEEDPVGDFGRGVREAAQFFEHGGVERVDVKLYPAMRHEVHNELGKEQALTDITAWLADVLSPALPNE